MTRTLPDVEVLAVCHDCRRKHRYQVQPADLAQAMGDWGTKHAGHRTAFAPARPVYTKQFAGWLRDFWSACPLWAPLGYQYGHNADAKVAYAASAAYTFGVASLATSSTRTAGREGTAVSNTSNKYLDYLIGGTTRTGTSPTAGKQIDLWVYAAYNDTPTYPDVFDGTDSAETVTSENVRNTAIRLAASAIVDSTSDRDYPFAPVSLASLFGGWAPTHHGLFLAHDTAVNLNSTGGNHVFSYTPLYGTVA